MRNKNKLLDASNTYNRLYNGLSNKRTLYKVNEANDKLLADSITSKTTSGTRAVLFRPNTKKIVFIGDDTKENSAIVRKENNMSLSATLNLRKDRLVRPNLGPSKIPGVQASIERNT